MADEEDAIDQQLMYDWDVDSPATYTSGQLTSELQDAQRYDGCDLSDMTPSFLSAEVEIDDQEVFIEDNQPLYQASSPLDTVALFGHETQTMPSPILSLRHSSITAADNGTGKKVGTKSTKVIENGFADISLTNTATGRQDSLPQFQMRSCHTSNHSYVSQSIATTSSPRNILQTEFPVIDDSSTFYSPLPVAMMTSSSPFARNCCYSRSPFIYRSSAVADSPLTQGTDARTPTTVFDFDMAAICDQFQFPNNTSFASASDAETSTVSFRGSSTNGSLFSKMAASPVEKTFTTNCKYLPATTSSIGRRRMGVSSDDFCPTATNMTVSEVRIKSEMDFASPGDNGAAYDWSASSSSCIYGEKKISDSVSGGMTPNGLQADICDQLNGCGGIIFSERRSSFSGMPTISTVKSRVRTSLGRRHSTESTAETVLESQTVLGSCVTMATASDDVLRRKKRREQNRRAARKCREKKKENVDSMRKAFDRTQEENARLRVEKDKLQIMVLRLQDMMRFHRSVCKLQPPERTQQLQQHQRHCSQLQPQCEPHLSAQKSPLFQASTCQVASVTDSGTMSHCCQSS